VALLLFDPLGEAPPSPEAQTAIPAELVTWAEETTAPPLAQMAERPQEPAPPLPQKPTPPQPRPSLPTPKPQPPKAATPQDDFASRLKALAQQQRPLPPPSVPQPRDGEGASNTTARSADSAPGRHAGYGVKDLIRVQIARHWEPDPASLDGAEVVVSLHLSLTSDGHILGIEVVDDPRFSAIANYRALADSARRAAQLAAPFQLPPGAEDVAGEVTVSLNSRDLRR
jgi:protein TonB